MSQEKLIAWYTQRLQKVKEFWSKDSIRGPEYIKFAEEELEAVKAGRNW